MLTDSDRIIYAARLKGYLNKHAEAVELLTEGIEGNPDDPRLWRHRGHRRITARDYEGAVADLQRAAELIQGQPDEHEYFQSETEPDIINIILGREELVREQHLPVNEETIAQTTGLYKSTLHGSVWYHLAIAQYLLADFEGAANSFKEAGAVAIDDDMHVAIRDWLYMSLRRLGRHDEASELLDSISTEGFNVNPGEDFYLRRLELYKGEVTPEALLERNSDDGLALATQGYGVGNWYLYNDRPDDAKRTFELVQQRGNPNGFAFMAAVADLQRLS